MSDSNKIIEDINKAMKLLEDSPKYGRTIYLNCLQVKYKEYLEKAGLDVVIVDDLPNDIFAIYPKMNYNKLGGKFENE